MFIFFGFKPKRALKWVAGFESSTWEKCFERCLLAGFTELKGGVWQFLKNDNVMLCGQSSNRSEIDLDEGCCSGEAHLRCSDGCFILTIFYVNPVFAEEIQVYLKSPTAGAHPNVQLGKFEPPFGVLLGATIDRDSKLCGDFTKAKEVYGFLCGLGRGQRLR
ncbi:MAG: hypothetical protein ACPLTR_10675 [Thermacetogeniaceae bacterium]